MQLLYFLNYHKTDLTKTLFLINILWLPAKIPSMMHHYFCFDSLLKLLIAFLLKIWRWAFENPYVILLIKNIPNRTIVFHKFDSSNWLLWAIIIFELTRYSISIYQIVLIFCQQIFAATYFGSFWGKFELVCKSLLSTCVCENVPNPYRCYNVI